MDIQLQIDSLLHKIQDVIDIKHVTGHQDTKKGTKLTWVEKLNVRAYQLATLARYHLQQKQSAPLLVHFPQARVQLYIKDKPVTKWVSESIHRASTSDVYI